jgi:hypothetical protein
MEAAEELNFEVAVQPPGKDELKELNIHQRMFQAASLISVLVKRDENKFQHYKYVSHDDVVAKVRRAFQACGILCVMDIQDHTLETINTADPEAGGKAKFQTLATVKAEMVFINPDHPEDRFMVHIPSYSLDTSDKALGKAISYAKKYAMIALSGLMLATGDDADQDNLEMTALGKPPEGEGDSTPPPRTQARTSQAPPPPTGSGTVEGVVSRTHKKETSKPGKYRYGVQIAGEWFNTFSESIANACPTDAHVVLTWKKSQWGKDIVTASPLSEAAV